MFVQIILFKDEIKIIETLSKKNFKFFSLWDPVMDNWIYKFTIIKQKFLTKKIWVI